MADGLRRWGAMGHCVYGGDDTGSLIAECSSRAVAEALVTYANGSFALRKKVAEAVSRREAAGATRGRRDD